MKTNPLSFRKTLIHWFGAPLLLALLLANLQPAAAQVPPSLFTSAPTFVSTNHILSTTVFHWFTATGGQVSGPWVPMGGRASWDGSPAFWQGQIKQMMMANIDMLYVHQYADSGNANLSTTNFPASATDQQLVNFFTAYSQLRAQGYDVPKIAPFLDTQITWNQTTVDLSTTAGKDAWANQYIRFYSMYYSVNTDTNADTYLAKQSNKPILDVWSTAGVCLNVNSLARTDVSSRLVAALGTAHPCFTNGFVQVGCGVNPTVSFVDEKLYQFEITAYTASVNFNGIGTMQLKAGYWDQNIRTPGSFLARAGGLNYSNAWNYPNRATVLRANLESWNEYDEGTGIYAGTNAAPYITNGNTNTDTWSTTGDPFEYIKTTARGAAIFCDVPAQSAKMLWSGIPATLMPGESRTVTVIVRNAGSALWNNASNYKLGQSDATPIVSGGRVLLNDTQDEIPLYGGIFRGRAKTFTFTITAPANLGNYTNHFQMLQESVAWFGDTLTNVITVKTKTAATVTLGNLSQVTDGYNPNPVTASTTPSGLTVNLTYNGSPYAPTNAGSYTVVGLINDANYYGSMTNTLVITANTDPVPNWSFEAQPTGTTVTSPPDVVADTTITGWRVFDIDSANVAFSATIITNASVGSHALSLNVNNTGGSSNYALDQWNVGMHTPVQYGTNYLISFDAAWIAGATTNNLVAYVNEFDNTGTFIGTSENLGRVSVSATGYQTFTFSWTPANPGTTEIGFGFVPMQGVVGTTTVSLDNVQMVDVSTLPAPWNGSFEYSPAGAVVSAPLGGGSVVDGTTLVGWRFVNVVPASSGLTASIITNASAGKQALRLDATTTGAGGYNAYIDQWNAGMQTPVVYGSNYLISVDAAWIAGVTSHYMSFGVQEFDNTGTYDNTGESLGNVSMSSTGYTTHSFLWTPQNPSTAQISFTITPSPGVSNVSFSVDNIRIVNVTNLPVANDFLFAYSPIGTTSTIGTGGGVDTSTFFDWRLFSVGAPAIKGFTGTIVDAGSYAGGTPGSHAMRFVIDNTGSPTNFDYGLDIDNAKVPVVIGTNYTLSFDLELDGTTGGTELCEVIIAEFDASGAWLGDNAVSYTPTLPTDQTFHHYSVDYVPENPNTAKVDIAFRPRDPGYVATLVLDNVVFAPSVLVASTPTLGSAQMSGHAFRLTFNGPANQSYEVLSSTNVALPVARWVTNSSGTFNGSPVIYTNNSPAGQEYYRIKSP